ncbi:MAG: alkaline phosphatase family protein [Thermomicrobiales bacterium]|nr:alkaline phosphatase family protein [Thermomicrobiales bacterium]
MDRPDANRRHERLVTPLRAIRWVASAVVVEVILLALLAWLLPGFSLADPAALVPMALLILAVQSVLWPFAYDVAVRFGPWLFPLVSTVLAGAAVALAAWLNDRFLVGGVVVADLWSGVLVALGLTVGSTLLAAVFSLDDEPAYDRFVTRPLRSRFHGTPRSPEPGFLFLEIDGLSDPVLRRALAEGHMPTLARWLESGSHRLIAWDPDLSCQTSASQAGILLGSNDDIPAFRWWDKPRRELMVSSHRSAAHALEEALSTGNGLLARGGAGRWNAFSGNAVENIGVYSVFGDAQRGSANSLLGYLFSPYMIARLLTLYVLDVMREWRQAWWQRHRDVRPRVARGVKYSLVRAATTTAMQEASRAILTADMLRGLPSVYNTFYGYDEVAHHAGIDREDALAVLTTIDRVIAHLERVAADAPRPYHLIVLSDHGQSQGATFLQRYGVTLADLTRELVAADAAEPVAVLAHLANEEEQGHIDVTLSEAVRGDTRTARTLRRVLPATDGDERGSDAGPAREPAAPSGAEADVIVLASGNLGLISFPRWPQRMSREELDAAFPKLLAGLVAHPGIAFVMVRSEACGPLAIGAAGTRALQTGAIEGIDPLAPFEPNAPAHLLRSAGFANAPDVLVISATDPISGEVPAFEELVGSHGGLGGPQREPILLYPTVLDPGRDEIVGTAGLHAVLKGWVDQAQGAAEPASPAPAAEAVGAPHPGSS